MRGEITLRVRCLMPERLIDRATAQGARFDSICPDGRNGLVITCDAPSADTLLALCRRFNLPARITGRRGTSAAGHFARRRITLAAGIACAILLSALFLSRLWFVDIEFTGENAALGDAAAMTGTLEALGIRPGCSRRIDTALLAQQLQAHDRRYSYVGTRLHGVRLLVEAAPEAPAPPLYALDAPRDLISAVDGIVVSAVVRAGEACVEPGEVVKRGELLIRGEERSAEDAMRPIAALGEVIVRTWVTGEASVPDTEIRVIDTGHSTTGAKLTILGWEWPITSARDYASQRTEREYLPIGGLFLPLQIERETHFETRREVCDIPREVLRARAMAMAMADGQMVLVRKGPPRYTAGRSWVDYSHHDGALYARAVFEIQTDAAVTREALQGG